MSVYKEGFHALNMIQTNSKRIYPDAADFGALVQKEDKLWKTAKQLIDEYAEKGTRKEERYATGCTVEAIVKLVDEGAVSDERKTVSEATERYRVVFVGVQGRKIQSKYDGYIYAEKIEAEKTNNCHVCGRAFNGDSALCGRCKRDVQ